MIFDVNTYLGHWPFRQLRYNTADKLIELMIKSPQPPFEKGGYNKNGIDKAVVSSINAIFYKNCQSGNEELATETQEHRDRFIPFATLNPMYPGWEDDFQVCVEKFNMKGIRMFPHYHNYKLTDDASMRLIHEATQLGMPVSIPMRVVDRRQRHWLDSARDLSLVEFEEIIRRCPETTFILTNGVGWENSQLVKDEFFKSCNFLIEISRLTSVLQESIPRLLDALGPTKLAFGTGIPFKYPRPTMLKMEILEASEEVKEQIYWQNIVGILGDT